MVFDQLEAAFGAERGPSGEPSVVRTFAAYGLLLDDGAVEVVSITINR
jgi:hypothetical protein